MRAGNGSFSLKVTAIIAFLAMVVVNGFSAVGRINGASPQSISASYPNLFTPAGVTFAIWSVIYLLLLLYAIYQAGAFRTSAARLDAPMFNRINLLFLISSLCNIGWVFAWSYRSILLAWVLMLGILVTLTLIARIFAAAGSLSARERIVVQLPFAVYHAWIIVATIANTTVLLVSLGVSVSMPAVEYVTAAVVVVGAIIGVLAQRAFRSLGYGCTFIWAYAGILLRQLSGGADGLAGAYPVVVVMVALGIAAFFAAAATLVVGTPAE